MILVDSLGDDYPTFPMFQRMLRAYERELAARPPPTPAPRARVLAIPARTSVDAVESSHRHDFRYDVLDNVYVCWCGKTHTMADILNRQGPQ